LIAADSKLTVSAAHAFNAGKLQNFTTKLGLRVN